MRIQWGRALLAGILGSLVFSAIGIWVMPLLGLPESNPAHMLAEHVEHNMTLGWAGHLAIGAVLAVLYAFVAEKLPGSPPVRGALFSLAPWLLVLVLSALAGFFSLPAALGSLLGHLGYGVVMGAIYGPVPRPSVPEIH